MSRRLRWAGHVTRMVEGRSVFKILTGTPTVETFRKDNIRTHLKDLGTNTWNSVESAQDRK